MMKIKLAAVAVVLAAACAWAQNPKREFRGAWLHTVYQNQYKNKDVDVLADYLTDQLDRLKDAGVNVVIFQVRPSADAFYESSYELWSRFLTNDGKAPDPYFDPLDFMVQEAHARGMELHAWLNPYRVTTAKNEKLPAAHLYNREPWRFVKYRGDDKIYFDPALPENREFICQVVADIVENYDVDAIHFDDYFYPYPAGGCDFPDDNSYAKYGNGMDRGDWRRQNVDQLIEMVHDTIAGIKPWVRFGISPFGIWRNKTSDPRGSDTAGLENYDGLYADVLLWAEKGWIDYLVPQLYWALEHPKASSLVLAHWWNDAVPEKCQLYFGQDVKRTMTTPDLPPSTEPNQLNHKISLSRELDNVMGNCWWPGYALTADADGSATALKADAQSTIALPPVFSAIKSRGPQPVADVRIEDGVLRWALQPYKGADAECVEDAVRYVVYHFPFEAEKDYDNPTFIYAITGEDCVEVEEPGFYSITALDRVNNESTPTETYLW